MSRKNSIPWIQPRNMLTFPENGIKGAQILNFSLSENFDVEGPGVFNMSTWHVGIILWSTLNTEWFGDHSQSPVVIECRPSIHTSGWMDGVVQRNSTLEPTRTSACNMGTTIKSMKLLQRISRLLLEHTLSEGYSSSLSSSSQVIQWKWMLFMKNNKHFMSS